MSKENKNRSSHNTVRPRDTEPEMATQSSRFVRQYQFDPTVYSHFEHETEQRGATPGGIFRKVMQDYLGGVYLTVDDLMPETIDELKRYAKQTFGSRNLQAAMSAILNKWADAETSKHRPK